jgi:Trk K+ transport system NAD-binding subunit
MARRPKRLSAHLRYLGALLRRFRVTVVMGAVLLGVMPLVYTALYVSRDGTRLEYGQAFQHVYFLLFGEPSLPYNGNFWIGLLNVLIPPLGIAVVVDGIVRFAYLYFAKHRSDKEWIQVISQSFKNHVVVCGAGRVGYRIVSQLRELDKDIVVIEKNENGAFVSSLRDLEVPVLIDNVTNPQSLDKVNVKEAEAIVCATDDDLANLNFALDARRVNPNIRVVIRLFDDDLVERVRDTFDAEALSTSALAAPALALAALDPRIIHSFEVGNHLMVVSKFNAGSALAQLTVSDVRDRFGGLTLAIRRGNGQEELHPQGHAQVAQGEVLTIQSAYGDYLKLRDFTGERAPPLSGSKSRPPVASR